MIAVLQVKKKKGRCSVNLFDARITLTIYKIKMMLRVNTLQKKKKNTNDNKQILIQITLIDYTELS
jgi:hypothetical protein